MLRWFVVNIELSSLFALDCTQCSLYKWITISFFFYLFIFFLSFYLVYFHCLLTIVHKSDLLSKFDRRLKKNYFSFIKLINLDFRVDTCHVSLMSCYLKAMDWSCVLRRRWSYGLSSRLIWSLSVLMRHLFQ